MYRKFHLIRIAGIPITMTPLAVVGSMILWGVFAMLGAVLFQLDTVTAILGGLLAMILHWVGETLHQLGHAWVAARVGYPMREIRFLHVLCMSLYPRDEPELPAETHIKRALGGPPVSFAIGIIAGIVALSLRDTGGLAYALALFVAVENIFVFGFGAFLPTPFTDGGTLKYWWPRRGSTPPNA